ncbi:transglycosylase SLT domain-containing protein [Endothiovibrio diazotrophicus]
MSRRALLIGLLAAAGLVSPAAQADFYSYRDEYGVIHLTDRPPRSTDYHQITRSRSGRWEILNNRAPASAATAKRSSSANSARYARELQRVADRYDLDRRLLEAVVEVESAYNPHAVSRAGAVGLMQLMPDTAEELGVRNRWDPHQNLDGGARLLRQLIDRFGELELALAAYNAGENAVVQHGHRIPPYPETRRYVKKVMAAYRGG